jgi:hypothetical protein
LQLLLQDSPLLLVRVLPDTPASAPLSSTLLLSHRHQQHIMPKRCLQAPKERKKNGQYL